MHIAFGEVLALMTSTAPTGYISILSRDCVFLIFSFFYKKKKIVRTSSGLDIQLTSNKICWFEVSNVEFKGLSVQVLRYARF